MMDPLVKEANQCLLEGVVADADLLDAGMIFATGFAPFRGGPIHWSTQSGSKETVSKTKKSESSNH